MVQILVLTSKRFRTFTLKAADGCLRVWNVTQGMKIAEEEHDLLRFPLGDYHFMPEDIAALYPGIDPVYAMTTDLSRPLLCIPFFGEMLLLDGWHRVYQAATLGIEELPMYLLTQEEADRILLMQLRPECALQRESTEEDDDSTP